MATPSKRTPRSVHDPPDGISSSAHLTNRTHFLHTLLGNKTAVSTSSKLNVGLGYSQTKVLETNKGKCLPVPWSSHHSLWQRHRLGFSPSSWVPSGLPSLPHLVQCPVYEMCPGPDAPQPCQPGPCALTSAGLLTALAWQLASAPGLPTGHLSGFRIPSPSQEMMASQVG